MAFQTLEFEQPGKIKVRADIAGKRYKIVSLVVRHNSKILREAAPRKAGQSPLLVSGSTLAWLIR
jgi:hypothetical protein